VEDFSLAVRGVYDSRHPARHVDNRCIERRLALRMSDNGIRSLILASKRLDLPVSTEIGYFERFYRRRGRAVRSIVMALAFAAQKSGRHFFEGIIQTRHVIKIQMPSDICGCRERLNLWAFSGKLDLQVLKSTHEACDPIIHQAGSHCQGRFQSHMGRSLRFRATGPSVASTSS